MKSVIVKILKITGLSIAGILLLLFLGPILFPGKVAGSIKEWANKSIDGELNFSKARLSFFNHFPSLTLTLYDFTLKGSVPFKKDTLVNAGEIALGINVKSLLFDKSINIDKVFLSDAYMNVQVNEKGQANYNVYVDDRKKKASSNNDTANAALKLEKITIENGHLIYNDKSVQILIDAKGFNYSGHGDLSKAIFDLYSHAAIDSLDFYLGEESYLVNKKIDADLITKINTNSLAFFFQKNNLVINRLPVKFSGKLDFLQNGYDIDLSVNSEKSDLYDFITALPPQYLSWLQKTRVKGITDVFLTLKGKYIASTNTMPDLAFNMKIRDGYIKYEDAPLPVSNLFLNFDSKMPSINPDSLLVNVDSVFFNLDKDFFSAIITSRGIYNPYVSAKVNALLDLEKLDKAFGFPGIELKGKYELHADADGRYERGPDTASIRHENILKSIPAFSLSSKLENGYFKYDSLPHGVDHINFTLNSSCPDNDFRNTRFGITGLSATALNSFIKGRASLSSLKDMIVDASLQSNINLSDVQKIYPLGGWDLAGLLNIDVNAKGKYDPVKKTFPATAASLVLKDGVVKTEWYPDPVDHIQMNIKAEDADGTLKGLQINIQPASFRFGQKPFQMQASFNDFDDMAYSIKANGELELANIYKVFYRKGTEVSGSIKANLSLEGRQSDAVNGRYAKLNSEGELQLKDIQLATEYYPKPFFIKEGLFTFSQDKMFFKNFLATYGASDFRMDGYFQQVIDYIFSANGILKGNFKVSADYINIDEFMAYSSPEAGKQSAVDSANKPSSGVIIIPSNLDLALHAEVQKAVYNGLSLENVKGDLAITKGRLSIQKTGFGLIGANVLMDGVYGHLSPLKAFFDYHLEAKDFDIKKAYDEISLFHEMASAAATAQGIVSLDYTLKGILNDQMTPIYPSLEGGGLLSVKKVKVKGLKLFSAIGKKAGKDSLASPDLSKVDIKTKVKNNIITIERFKFKVAGFRPRIEGQTSFDGQLNLKMRLGLPPLGIIGIPIRVTGTQDDPKIRFGKNDKEDIPETEYKEEELKQ